MRYQMYHIILSVCHTCSETNQRRVEKRVNTHGARHRVGELGPVRVIIDRHTTLLGAQLERRPTRVGLPYQCGARQLSVRTPDSQSRLDPPFATVSKFWQFRSLHWHPGWLSCINECLAVDSGGNVSGLVVARNCCMARMLPGEAELVSEWTGASGEEKCEALWAVRRTGYRAI